MIKAIKNELYFSCFENGEPALTRNEISIFIDKAVQLSRYQPSFFHYFYCPQRTTSIKKLFEYFDLDPTDNIEFRGSHFINNYYNTDYNEADVELYNRIFIPNSDFNYMSQFIEEYFNPNSEAQSLRNAVTRSSQQEEIDSKIELAAMSYEEVCHILKDFCDISKTPSDIEINLEDKKNHDGIKTIKINLVDVIAFENILQNMDENTKSLFIVQKRGETLFFNPYSPESLKGTIEVKGLVEQTTRLPITLHSGEELNDEDISENQWYIAPKEFFKKNTQRK